MLISATWFLKQVAQQISANKKHLILSAELGRDFPEVESKGYDSETLAKKAKALRGNLN